MKFFYTFFLSLLLFFPGLKTEAQTSIPNIRLSFHDKIDKDQSRILLLDNKDDGLFTPSATNDSINGSATYGATFLIDSLQRKIEADSSLDNNTKIKYLRGLDEALTKFITNYQLKAIRGGLLPELVTAFEEAIPLEQNGESIASVIYRYPMEVGNILVDNFSFRQNPGLDKAKQVLITKSCAEHPDKTLSILEAHPEYEAMDSMLVEAAHRDPDAFYDYAASTQWIGKRIRDNKDLLVTVISQMAVQKSGRQYFPFLDNIYTGKITFDDIDKVKDNPIAYYKLLVATEIEYASRILQRDTPMGMNAINVKLRSALDPFLNAINGLHESPDAIRFKSLEPFNSQELYYLAVLTEEEIYTSSYLKGVYPQIFRKGGKDFTGDKLLMSVYFDHFKKWIKMAANYNTLDDFLKRMNKENADLLMRQFVRNLDQNRGRDSLEDAVDVAGSYASIHDPSVRKLILEEVQSNLAEARASHNGKAEDIYSILNTLFLSMDPANNIDVSKELGIQPVYYMPIEQLKDGNGRINIQQFFYGDKDGQHFYNMFLKQFAADGWKIHNTPEWTVVSSTKGTPINIYSNKPLDEHQGLDDKAQQDLNAYLVEHNIKPTIVIHRGHSYYLATTIKQLVPSAKIVLLGSCGGYQSLNDVLRISPEAHIISSRQTGIGNINISLITGIVNTLREGKTLNWLSMWKQFSKNMGKSEEFSDYVPPYNNLGAVFIMAYKRLQERNATE